MGSGEKNQPGIDAAGPPERRTPRRHTLWLDHGTDPADARYVYVLLPGASRRRVARRAADRGRLRILAGDGSRQAVALPRLGLPAAGFWHPGTAGPLTASSPAGVLVRRTEGTATLCVSDPTRTGEPLQMIWDHPVRGPVRAGRTVEILALRPRPRLRVTPGEAGATHRCEPTLTRTALCHPYKRHAL
ncbi:hypothetical protein SUDANB70_01721 [Streptomyces sp. enrichment culture]